MISGSRFGGGGEYTKMGREMKLSTHLGLNGMKPRSRLAGKRKEASRGSYLGEAIQGKELADGLRALWSG